MPPKKSQLAGIKTCADKIKKDNVNQVSTKINKKQGGDTKKGGAPTLRAAFLKGKILRANQILKCGFLSQPPADIVRTPLEELSTAVDENGVSLPLDPIQLEVDKMDIIPAIIHTITKRLQPIVNIKFKFYEDEEAKTLLNPAVCDIRIAFDPNKGAWSLLGKDILSEKDKTVTTMNLGWFDVPTTLHEFCHAIAMVHEHQNPNGVPIDWNVDAVHQWALESQGWDVKTTDENIINKYSKDQINGSEYDPLSIMLYFFPGTLVNKPGTKKCCGKGTQQNFQFSPYDVLFLNKIYPVNGQELTPEEFTVKFFSDNFNQTVDIEKLKYQIKKNSEEGYLFYEGLDGTAEDNTAVDPLNALSPNSVPSTKTEAVPDSSDSSKSQITEAPDSSQPPKETEAPDTSLPPKATVKPEPTPSSNPEEVKVCVRYTEETNISDDSCGCNIKNPLSGKKHTENVKIKKETSTKGGIYKKIILIFTVIMFLILLAVLINYMSSKTDESDESKI